MSATQRLSDAHFLQGFWPLDSNPADLSGHKNDGTWAAAEAYGDGPNGRKVGSFNGSSAHITTGALTGLTDEMTRAVWIKPTFSVSMNRYIMDAGNNVWWMQLYDDDADGYPLIRAGFGGGQFIDSAGDMPDDRWHHIVVTNPAAGVGVEVRMYIDGELNNTASKTITASPGAWQFGAYRYGAPSLYFAGLMRNIRIYNVELTGEEVKALFLMEQGGGN